MPNLYNVKTNSSYFHQPRRHKFGHLRIHQCNISKYPHTNPNSSLSLHQLIMGRSIITCLLIVAVMMIGSSDAAGRHLLQSVPGMPTIPPMPSFPMLPPMPSFPKGLPNFPFNIPSFFSPPPSK